MSIFKKRNINSATVTHEINKVVDCNIDPRFSQRLDVLRKKLRETFPRLDFYIHIKDSQYIQLMWRLTCQNITISFRFKFELREIAQYQESYDRLCGKMRLEMYIAVDKIIAGQEIFDRLAGEYT